MKIDTFQDVVNRYKVIFFDAFGVLKNYKGLMPGIENTFRYLKDHGKDFYILTNDASRSPDLLAESYNKLGIQEITAQKIISSGMLAREFLRLKVNKGTIAYLGTATSEYYIESLGPSVISMEKLNLENCSDVTALVMLDDEGFDWNHDINKTVNLLRKKSIPVIVANSDKFYPTSKREVAIAIGGIANMVEEIVGQKFIRFGKPDSQIFTFAYEHLKEQVNRNEILMVGDTLYTDILGANKFGIDTALVLSGNTLEEEAELRIKALGIIPDYICESAVINY